ncbi:undecaprenyl-phosphate galactose phosphotransferase WbaP [Hydrogenobacter thermophilus]|uniref:undecaprenyl-phosphate galactose phosphotransferase WbaP n=1 Tax=Hydrogenobacter thermophilus TaxID=940 RepID=UPI0030F4FD54
MGKRWQALTLLITLLTADLVAYYISLALAYLTRMALNPLLYMYAEFNFPLSHFLKMWWIPVIFLFFNFYEGLYQKRFPLPEELRRIVKSTFFGLFTLFFLVGLTKKSEEVSRLMLLILGLYMPLMLLLLRPLSKKLLFERGIGLRRFAVVGTDDMVKKASSFLEADRYMGYSLLGFFSDRDTLKSVILNGRTFRVKKLRHLKTLAEKGFVDCLVVSTSHFEEEELASFVYGYHGKVSEIILVPPLKGLSLINSHPLPVYMLDVFMLSFKDNLKTFPNLYIKRAFDLVLSFTLLPLVLFLTLIFSALIKLETGGPVFFSHTRIGQGGRLIKVYKFRTMHKDAQERLNKLLEERQDLREEWERYRKLKDDPRITRVGRFLRKTSLDELPQIFNVIRGDMSLVGPRPVTQEELEKYYGEFAQVYMMVKPGITGYWQVSGRSEVDYNVRVAMDIFYVVNWSLWLDIYILAKTLWVVLKGKGAY